MSTMQALMTDRYSRLYFRILTNQLMHSISFSKLHITQWNVIR